MSVQRGEVAQAGQGGLDLVHWAGREPQRWVGFFLPLKYSICSEKCACPKGSLTNCHEMSTLVSATLREIAFQTPAAPLRAPLRSLLSPQGRGLSSPHSHRCCQLSAAAHTTQNSVKWRTTTDQVSGAVVCLGVLCCFPLRSCHPRHPKGWLDRKVEGGLSHVWQLVLAVGWAASVLLGPPVRRTGLASCQGQAGFPEGRGQKQQDLMRPSLPEPQNATFIKPYWSKRGGGQP